MDIAQLKDKIINNNEIIEEILDKIGCGNIRSYSKEYRCAIDKNNSNSTGVSLNKETLSMIYRSSSKEVKGDIITLVQYKLNCTFSEAIKFLCDIVGLKYNSTTPKIILPFGGYYKQANAFQNNKNEYEELKIYPEEIMNNYLDKPNDRFLKDNISLLTQKEYNIRYDLETDRIAVCWRDSHGRIIGVMGRYNEDSEYCKKNNIAKWYPLIKFPKSQVLYGFSENYQEIQDKKIIFVGESEKFALQLHSMGVKNGIALGSHSISPIQANLIKSCFPERVILCYDEDIEEEYVREQCKLLTNSAFTNTKIGYIYDRNNNILRKGSKMSPSDLGSEAMKELIKNNLYYIN